MKLVVTRNPAYRGSQGKTHMARKGGLPGKYIRAHPGNLKAAWAAYRRSHGGRQRRNPTGTPLSGKSYRPRFHRRGSSIRHGRRAAVGKLSGLSLSAPKRRARVHTHRRRSGSFLPSIFTGRSMRSNPSRRRRAGRGGRRRARRNPAMGYGSPFRIRGIQMGKLGVYVPLVNRSAWMGARAHPLKSAGIFVVSMLFIGTIGYAGGTWAALGVTFIGGAALSLTGHATAGALFMGAGVAATILEMITSGSLSGYASLSSTLPNLKAQAAALKAALATGSPSSVISTLVTPSLSGLSGVPAPKIMLKLKGLGVSYRPTVNNYPITAPGRTFLPNGWGLSGRRGLGSGVPGTTSWSELRYPPTALKGGRQVGWKLVE